VSAPLVLRCASNGTWWALDKRETGWASFGYPFSFLGDALDNFGAELVGCGRDEHGLYLLATSKKESDS
jgi:hypothetical protein